MRRSWKLRPASDDDGGDNGGSARPFRALRTRNYRLFFIGQVLSVIGTWTQNTALAWIVLSEHRSSGALGLVVALQFTPLLVLGAWAGAIADRTDKRTMLAAANAGAAVVAVGAAVAVAAGATSIAVLGALSLLGGVAAAFETPARQSFAAELVAPSDLPSAIGLNSATMTGSRMVGSAVAGILLVVLGAPACLFLNAVSFGAVLVALRLMRPEELRRAPVGRRERGAVRAGFRYALATPELRRPLTAMAVIGTLALNALVTTPLLARISFDAGPGTFALFGAMGGLGALCGALTAASQREARPVVIGVAATAFGLLSLGVAGAPVVVVALPLLAASAFAASLYISSTNARLQRVTEPAFRGRVMSLYAILLLGSTPVGSIVVSAVAELTNPRVGVALGGVAAAVTGVVLLGSPTAR